MTPDCTHPENEIIGHYVGFVRLKCMRCNTVYSVCLDEGSDPEPDYLQPEIEEKDPEDLIN